ncbi:MAG: multiheme c-type cytochrome, partial [Bacteroidota bacterium]
MVPRVEKGAVYATDELSPAAAIPADGRYIHPQNLLDGGSCGDEGCHPDITAQWEQSAHHFASFNNPFYRRSVEGLLVDNDVAKARWCASCHDPLLLMAGDLDTEDPAFMDQHEHAMAGITCLACHGIKEVDGPTGNGNYVLSHPDYAAQATTPVGTFAGLRRTLIETKPGPHASAMLSQGVLNDQFCTSCHKVSVPPAVNDYRWKRGQDQYDAWYESAFSGKHPRAFYRRDQQNCISCHMPATPSTDQGNDDGFVKSHRFAAANTALPYLNGHPEQLAQVQESLQQEVAAVDIFWLSVDGKTYGPGEALPPLSAGQNVELE